MHRLGRLIIANGWGYYPKKRKRKTADPSVLRMDNEVRNPPGGDTHSHKNVLNKIAPLVQNDQQ